MVVPYFGRVIVPATLPNNANVLALSGASICIEETMNTIKLAAGCLLALGVAVSGAAQASQVVVDFENLVNLSIFDGYGGISGWNNVGGIQENQFISGGQGQYVFGGFNTAPGSGYGQDDGSAGLHFDQGPVVFDGAYFWNADVPAGAQTGILLYFQGQLVHRIADPLGTGLQWLASGYQGLVDTVYFAAGYDGFMIDNLTYSTPSQVPEPATLLMLVSSLGVLGLMRRHMWADDGPMKA